jgi:hypothetical protein
MFLYEIFLRNLCSSNCYIVNTKYKIKNRTFNKLMCNSLFKINQKIKDIDLKEGDYMEIILLGFHPILFFRRERSNEILDSTLGFSGYGWSSPDKIFSSLCSIIMKENIDKKEGKKFTLKYFNEKIKVLVSTKLKERNITDLKYAMNYQCQNKSVLDEYKGTNFISFNLKLNYKFKILINTENKFIIDKIIMKFRKENEKKKSINLYKYFIKYKDLFDQNYFDNCTSILLRIFPQYLDYPKSIPFIIPQFLSSKKKIKEPNFTTPQIINNKNEFENFRTLNKNTIFNFKNKNLINSDNKENEKLSLVFDLKILLNYLEKKKNINFYYQKLQNFIDKLNENNNTNIKLFLDYFMSLFHINKSIIINEIIYEFDLLIKSKQIKKKDLEYAKKLSKKIKSKNYYINYTLNNIDVKNIIIKNNKLIKEQENENNLRKDKLDTIIGRINSLLSVNKKNLKILKLIAIYNNLNRFFYNIFMNLELLIKHNDTELNLLNKNLKKENYNKKLKEKLTSNLGNLKKSLKNKSNSAKSINFVYNNFAKQVEKIIKELDKYPLDKDFIKKFKLLKLFNKIKKRLIKSNMKHKNNNIKPLIDNIKEKIKSIEYLLYKYYLI